MVADLCYLSSSSDQATTATTSTSTRSIISNSSMTKVRIIYGLSLVPDHALLKLTILCLPYLDTREEDLTHPEDIAHFAKHDREADEADRQEELQKQPINDANIPQKFRRS